MKATNLAILITSFWMFAVSQASAATITWINTSGGNWSVAANWSPNQVPASSDDAVITNNGTYAVTLDTSATIAGLTLGGASGIQTFSMGGNTLTLNGLGTINGNGQFNLSGTLVGTNTFVGVVNWTSGSIGSSANMTIATNGTLVLVGNNGTDYALNGVLINAGTIQLESGNLQLVGSGCYGGAIGELINLPGALVDITADVSIDNNGCAGLFVMNEGTVEKTGGTGISGINPPFDNFGLLDVQSGTVSLNGGGSSSGVFEADAGATLEFESSYSGALGSQIIGVGTNLFANGTVTLNGVAIANTVLAGGTVNLNGTITNAVLAGATLAGTNVIVGTMTWTSGSIGAGAVVTVATNGTLALAGVNGTDYGLYGVLTNAGTIQLESGNLQLVGSGCYGGAIGELINLPGALVDITADVSIDNNGCAGLFFMNEGTVEKTGGTGISSINPTFDNFGLLDVQTGTVSLNGGGELDGNATVAVGAQLNFAGGSYSGSGFNVSVTTGAQVDFGGATLNGAVNLSGPASVLVMGGSGTLNPSVPLPNLVIANGTLTLNGTVTNLLLGGGSLQGYTTIAGTMTWTNGSIGAGAVMTIATNGTLALAGVNGTDYNSGGTVTNAGIVELESGNLNLTTCNGGTGQLINLPGALIDIQSDVSINNDGDCGPTLVLNEGTVQKTGGTGTSSINPNFDNFGLLDAQSGTISLNNGYSLTNGTLSFGLSGPTNFGAINLSGSAQLGGGLSANLNGNYAPAVGDSFPVLTYGSASGQFTNVFLPVLAPTEIWQLSYSSSTGVLQVVSNPYSTFQITGSVTNSLGNAVTNIAVFADTTDSGTDFVFTTFTDSKGDYALNVPSGTFQVGLEGLPDRGYYPVTNQRAIVSGGNGVVVNFVVRPYSGQLFTVTTTVNPPGVGAAIGAGLYTPGSVATVIASPNPGPLPYWFGNWSENGTVLTTNSSYDFVVNGNQNLVANFIWPSPVITMQPQSLTVETGTLPTLSVAASGALPMSYQWQFNGTNLVNGGQISGSQSNVLTVSDAQAADSGNYQVLVTNAYGSTNSTVATLNVIIAAHPSRGENLFATDLSGGNLYEFIDYNGTLTNVTLFASGLNQPYALAFNSAGDLFEADYGSGNIYEFTNNNGTLSTNLTRFASGLDGPTGLAFNRAGDLFVSEWNNDDILEFTNNKGTLSSNLTLFASGLNGPEGLAFNSAGDLFVANETAASITEIAFSGAQSPFIDSGLDEPDGLVFNSAGSLFVANQTGADGTGYIIEITPSGAQSTFVSGLDGPQGLAMDNEDDLFEADWVDGLIYEFTPNGGQIALASGLNVMGPEALAFQPTLELQGATANGTLQVIVTMPSPYSSTILQASTNLVNWINIYTNKPPFTFTDPTAMTFPYRFYRAVMQ